MNVTVNQLITHLQNLKKIGHGESLIVLSVDDEWNGFRILDNDQIGYVEGDNLEYVQDELKIQNNGIIVLG